MTTAEEKETLRLLTQKELQRGSDMGTQAMEIIRKASENLSLLRSEATSPATITPTVNPLPIDQVGNVVQVGTPYTGSHLANLVCGGPSNLNVAFAFTAKYSGSPNSLRAQLIRKPGNPDYAAGTGGTIRVEIRTDYSSEPGTNVIATDVVFIDLLGSNPAPLAHLFQLSSSAKLVKGQRYWAVFTNTDPEPTKNYISLNCLSGYDRFHNRWHDSTDQLPAKYFHNGQWKTTIHTPILEIGLEGGQYQGTTLFEGYSWNSQPPVRGDNTVIQNLDLPYDVKVEQMAVYASRDFGTGPLRVRFVDFLGDVVGHAQLAASKIALETPAVVPPNPHRDSAWYDLQVDQSFYLHAQIPYTAEFYTDDDNTQYFVTPARMGINHGFKTHGFFGSNAQVSSDGGRTRSNWPYSGKRVNDAQLSMLLNPGSPEFETRVIG